MRKTVLFALWGSMFALCAVFGFFPQPQGFLKWLLVAFAAAFFAPPAVLVCRAAREGDRATMRLVRNLSIASLVLTVAILICNFLCVMAPEALGNALYVLLVIVSSPMVCGQYWLLSLFLWAALMVCCISRLPRKKHL